MMVAFFAFLMANPTATLICAYAIAWMAVFVSEWEW